MKIQKKCTQEIVQYETTSDDNIYIKKQFTLGGVLKRTKELNINQSQVGRKFCRSSEQALNHLIDQEGYEVI